MLLSIPGPLPMWGRPHRGDWFVVVRWIQRGAAVMGARRIRSSVQHLAVDRHAIGILVSPTHGSYAVERLGDPGAWHSSVHQPTSIFCSFVAKQSLVDVRQWFVSERRLLAISFHSPH